MRPFALLAATVMLVIPMSGCMDIFGGEPEGRTLEFTLEIKPGTSDSVPLYTLNDGVSQMNVVAMGFTVPGQQTLTVPNPEIRLREGDTLILNIENNNPLMHTFHLHGGLVDWDMDGVPFLNQLRIMNGESYRYVFEDLKAGTYFYHCHVDVAHHIDLGMYGAFIVEEHDPEVKFDRDYVLMLDEWDNCHVHGSDLAPVTNSEQSGHVEHRRECLERVIQDYMAQNSFASTVTGLPQLDPVRSPTCDAVATLPPEAQAQLAAATRQLGCDGGHAPVPPQQSIRTWYPVTFPVYAPEYNTFTINGKAFPDTQPLPVTEGERIKLRLINVGEEMHSMHIHGHKMLVTHRDGYEVPSPFYVDTLGILPGERYDVVFEADNPGVWAFHDHIGLNVMNDDHSPGGMFTCIAYDGWHDLDAFNMARSIECYDHAMMVLGGHDGHTGRR